MPVEEYAVVQPVLQSTVGRAWHHLAQTRPERAERLLDALEDAVTAGLASSYRVLPQNPGSVEVFMVPPRYALLVVSDAAALVRVDHVAQTIEIIEVVENYGNPNEPAQWLRLQQIAAQAIPP